MILKIEIFLDIDIGDPDEDKLTELPVLKLVLCDVMQCAEKLKADNSRMRDEISDLIDEIANLRYEISHKNDEIDCLKQSPCSYDPDCRSNQDYFDWSDLDD